MHLADHIEQYEQSNSKRWVPPPSQRSPGRSKTDPERGPRRESLRVQQSPKGDIRSQHHLRLRLLHIQSPHREKDQAVYSVGRRYRLRAVPCCGSTSYIERRRDQVIKGVERNDDDKLWLLQRGPRPMTPRTISTHGCRPVLLSGSMAFIGTCKEKSFLSNNPAPFYRREIQITSATLPRSSSDGGSVMFNRY